MAKRQSRTSPEEPTRIYWGADIPMRIIRRYARAVAEQFHPERIYLFGSHAYGTPHADSDVDLLVVMPAANQHSQAVRIRAAVPAPFPLDLLVRTPREMARRLADGDLFHSEIVAKGKVLYESGDARVGTEGRGRLARRPRTGPPKAAPP